jgi:hypothetical protein
MPIDDHGRGASPIAPPGNAWTLLDYQAHRRMAELLIEAEQDGLARRARVVRRAGPDELPSAARDRLIQSAQSAVAAFARRLAFHRPRTERPEMPSG